MSRQPLSSEKVFQFAVDEGLAKEGLDDVDGELVLLECACGSDGTGACKQGVLLLARLAGR